MNAQTQPTLFGSEGTGPSGEEAEEAWKTHKGGNGAIVRYRRENDKLILFESVDGEIGRASWHPSQGGKWSASVGDQPIHIRDRGRTNLKGILTRIALAKKDIESAREIQRLGKLLEESAQQRLDTSSGEEAEAPAPRHRNRISIAGGDDDAAENWVNPWDEKPQLDHSPAPDWYSELVGPTSLQKMIFGRLHYPADVCDHFEQNDGIIFGLSVEMLAAKLGCCAKGAKKALRGMRAGRFRVIEFEEGLNGRIKWQRFVDHPARVAWKASNKAKKEKKATEKKRAQTEFDYRNRVPVEGNSVPAASELSSSSKRVREEEIKENESLPREAKPHRHKLSPLEPEKTRDGSEGKDSSRFAEHEDSNEDPLWGDLHRFLGLSEMHQNGKAWKKRFNLSRRALLMALEDAKNNTADVKNRGAYVIARFEQYNREANLSKNRMDDCS